MSADIKKIGDIEFSFTRRRYEKTTYTWVRWRRTGEEAWQHLNVDPWPCINVPKADLERLASRLTPEYIASGLPLETIDEVMAPRALDGIVQSFQ